MKALDWGLLSTSPEEIRHHRALVSEATRPARTALDGHKPLAPLDRKVLNVVPSLLSTDFRDDRTVTILRMAFITGKADSCPIREVSVYHALKAETISSNSPRYQRYQARHSA